MNEWQRGRSRRRHGPPFPIFALWIIVFAAAGGWAWHYANGADRFLEPLIFLVLAVSAGLFAYVTGRFTRRLGRLTSAVEAITLRDLAARVPAEGSDSVGRLGQSFNHMLDRLAAEERVRRELFADVAHEIRHPLASLLARLELMQDGITPPSPQEILALYDAAAELSRLVRDVQELSLADVGQLALDCALMDTQVLAAQILELLLPVAEDRGVRLTVRADGDWPSMVGDAPRMRQVLLNLVTNGLYHTPPGGHVEVAVSRQADEIQWRVRDTGSGMSPDVLPHIFDRFFRADTARTRQPGAGSGLGLAIVRSLVELHGGRVEVASVLGEGTVFTVRLPRDGPVPG